MHTRSSSNLLVESSPNLTTSNPKRRYRRRSKQPFILEESSVDTMADQRTMEELLRAPTEGYAETIVVPPILAEQFELKHSLINMMTSNQFFRLEKDNPYDHIRCDANSFSSKIAKLTHAVNQQTSVVTTAMTAILKQFQATPPPAFVKAIKEICVTCGAAVNYNQGNSGYRPPGVANQIRPPDFAQPNVQTNQNRFSQPQGYNRGNNCNQDQSYQAPTQQNQVVPLTSMSNQTNELKNMMASFFQMNTASTSGSRSLPSNTIANPKGELKSITTRSGIVLDGPSVPIPTPFINPKEDERVEETLTDQNLAYYTIKVPPPLVQKPKPPSQRKFVVHQRDPLHPNIPYPLRIELKCKALADLGASINFMPLSVWKKLGLPELISTRMTLELANRAICTPGGIARDVFVPVGKFTFPADFVIVDYESDPRVPLILGRPFLRTARALIDVHEEEMILRDVKDDIFDPKGGNVLIEKLLDLASTKDPRGKLLNINLLIAKIKSLNENPTHDHVLKPLSPSLILVEDSNFFLEKSDTSLSYSNNSLPEFETFSNHTEETNSGCTTTHADYSLPKKFDPGELTSIVDFEIREKFLYTTNVNLPPEEDHSLIFAYVVWTFLSFLTYPVVPPNLLSFGNEDTIFDPGISNYHFPSLLPDVSHRCETFMKFNVYPKLLNESPMEILSSTFSPMDQ
uniref:Reverse transcriptase domain-containing protein n=1 Tax=Tanacetum cinerariifolium TaxID=118510 RepID=A0A699HQV9_TANCI|nr:reverse transcriptase domain-containing protein [Tanacetum cinerariifolium]